MADETQTAKGGSSHRWLRSPQNRVQWAVIGGLAGLLIIGGLVGGAVSKKELAGTEGTRVVIVPGDRVRTIVVPACGTGVRITAANAEEQVETPGATIFAVPRARGTRAVMVPRCGVMGGSASPSGAPSAAYVLPTAEAKVSGFPVGAAPPATLSKLILPMGSRADTAVVTSCTKETPREQTVVLALRPAGSRTALAPPC